MSAWFVSLMPLALTLVLVVFEPTYMIRLVDNGLGRMILFGAIGMWLLGVVWFQRLSKFEY